MDGIDIDVSDLWPLAADLGASGERVLAGVRPIMEKTALNTKVGMQADFKTGGHAKHAWRAIDYDIQTTFGGSIEAEVGFNKGKRQGSLGNFLAFGSSRNGPIGDITAAARREEPSLAEHLIRLATESLNG